MMTKTLSQVDNGPSQELSVSVRLLTDSPESAKQWDHFIMQHPDSSSEHLWAWRHILTKAFGYKAFYLGAFDKDGLAGVLPLFRIPRGLGHAYSSIPFGNYAGICAKSEYAGTALFQAAKELLRRSNGKYLELHHQNEFRSQELKTSERYSGFKWKIQPEKVISLQDASLFPKLPKQVRHALKGGLKIEISRDVEPLYKIHLQTSRRQGTPSFPKSYFQEALNQFKDQAEIQYACLNGRPIAYLFLFYFKNKIIGQFNGSESSFLKFYPNNLLYWYQMENGLRRGLTEVDFGRSRKDSGAAGFKRQLHLEETPLHYQFYIPNNGSLPSHNPSNPKYKLLINYWQKLPLTATSFLGPKIVRYLA